MEKNSKQEKTNPALPRTANTPDILVCRFAPLTLSSPFSFPLLLYGIQQYICINDSLLSQMKKLPILFVNLYSLAL